MSEKVIKNWIKLSDYDLKTAKSMLEGKRYLYVAFMCQQAIEKILKAFYVKEINKTPPYTHNLIKLVDSLSLSSSFDAKKNNFIEILNSYYIESRYTEDIEEISKLLTKDKALKIYNETEELYKWLKDKI